MGDELWAGLDDIGEAGFQEARHLQMVALAGAPQQRAIGRILNQRMFEDIFGAWRPAALIEQFGIDN